MVRYGICFLHSSTLGDQIKYTRYADKMGFDSVWVTESQLENDAFSLLGSMAAVTKRIRLGTGVVNNWKRGPALMALTLATLHEISKGRVMLGIGAYWDPLASKQGIQRKKPLKAMREYLAVVRRLLNLETVTLEGEIVKVRDLRLDLAYGSPWKPKNVPIYIGATGLKMAELAGEITDGILLNACLPVEYTRKCVDSMREGAKKAGRDADKLARPQLLAFSMMKDGDKARRIAKQLVALYLGMVPHFRPIATESGIKEELMDEIGGLLGEWPANKSRMDDAIKLV